MSIIEGILGKDIVVYGDWLPRHINNKGTALFASIRMIYATLASLVCLRHKSFDLVIIDGVSTSIPLIKVI